MPSLRNSTSCIARHLCVGLALAITAPTAIAGAEQIPRDREITILHAYDNIALVDFSPAFTHTQNCSGTNTTNRVLISFDGANNSGRAMYATAMTAYSLGKRIGIGINGCIGTYVRAYRIDLGK